ncbi:MAG: hypothetical protein AUJ82_02850 [Verrucomicrobia bacterium CG1_02_43_26]|nr:MAG: hypothetical protein AUJ82_02850 [Verrucomicrobia bacterium CG1_02_43_26]
MIESWLLIALAVVIAAHTTDKINYSTFGTLVLVAITLSLLNVILKPLLILFTLPFILITFGLGIWIINALLLLLVAKLIPGFEVSTMGAALWGALIISLISMIANRFIIRRFPMEDMFRKNSKRFGKSKKDDDVIDI